MANPTPTRFTRSTSEAEIDQFNQWMRAQPWHQAIMRGRSSGLSRSEQSRLEEAMRQAGVELPDGFHVDQGGNANQVNRLGRNIGIGAAIGGGALTGFGLAGMGPLAGLGGGASAAGAGGVTAGGAGTAAGTGAGAAATGAATAGAGFGLPGWVAPVVGAGLGTANYLRRRSESDGYSGGEGDPVAGQATMQAQLQQLLDLSMDRQKRIAPVHEAAMQLAMRLAPPTGGPRLASAVEASRGPVERMDGPSPEVLDAIRRLTSGAGRV